MGRLINNGRSSYSEHNDEFAASRPRPAEAGHGQGEIPILMTIVKCFVALIFSVFTFDMADSRLL